MKVLQTQASVLFFAGSRVYKLRKPEVLDLGDPAERRRSCEEEVRLNRRVAPKMYLGVRAVTREPDGRLTVDGDGEAVDWVVEMVRLPEERMLDALLERDDVGRAQLEQVAAVLARFHQRALTGPSVNRHGLPSAVADAIHENLHQLGSVAARSSKLVPATVLAFLAREVDRFLQRRRRLLERRVGDWRIREGHGDLRAGNVCIVDGQVCVYGCVAFDRRLRCGDVASDLAVLAMDLDHHGHAAAARILVTRYAHLTSDDDLLELLDFYKLHRALERAKAELLAAEKAGLSGEERRARVLAAARYTQLAVAYRLPPCLVLVGGTSDSRAPASSADHVAERLRARLLRDDERDRRDLVRQAAAHLQREDPVVVHAAHVPWDDQRLYLDAAVRLGVPLFAVHLDGTETPSGVPPSRAVHVPEESGPEEVGLALQERMIAAFESAN